MSFFYTSPPDTSSLDDDIRSVAWTKLTAEPSGVDAYRLVHNSGSPGVVGHADFSDPSKMPVFGITKDAILPGSLGIVYRRGEIEYSGWSWLPNKPLFAGADGNLTQTLPVGPNTIHKVGWAITATKIYFELGTIIKREV